MQPLKDLKEGRQNMGECTRYDGSEEEAFISMPLSMMVISSMTNSEQIAVNFSNRSKCLPLFFESNGQGFPCCRIQSVSQSNSIPEKFR
jgi:hypothetical protein